MAPEQRFSRWAAKGVPFLLAIGVLVTSLIHKRYGVSWQQLLVPAGMIFGLQIGTYLCWFWAGKWAREKGRFGPGSLLGGFGLGAMVYLGIHFGAKWGIVSKDQDDPIFFWTFMVIVTAISWLIAAKFGKKFLGTVSELEK
jgi:hypothetical protein